MGRLSVLRHRFSGRIHAWCPSSVGIGAAAGNDRRGADRVASNSSHRLGRLPLTNDQASRASRAGGSPYHGRARVCAPARGGVLCSHGYSAVARTTSSRTSRPRRGCSAWPVRWSSPYCLPCNFCGEVGSLALDAASSDERRQPGSLYRSGQRRLTRCRLRSSGCSVSTKPRSRQSRRIAALRSSTSPKISPMLSVRA